MGKGESRETGRRKENNGTELGRNEVTREGERSENESKTATGRKELRGESAREKNWNRGTLVPLGRKDFKQERPDENGRPKLKTGEKDLDSVVSRIKGREVDRRSRKDATAGLEEKEWSGVFSHFESSSGGNNLGGSRKQEQLLAKISRGPTLVKPSPTRMKETRPKGKTIRKVHNDPPQVGSILLIDA